MAMTYANNPSQRKWRSVPEVRIPHRSRDSVDFVLRQAAELIVTLAGENIDAQSKAIVGELDELRRVIY